MAVDDFERQVRRPLATDARIELRNDGRRDVQWSLGDRHADLQWHRPIVVVAAQ